MQTSIHKLAVLAFIFALLYATNALPASQTISAAGLIGNYTVSAAFNATVLLIGDVTISAASQDIPLLHNLANSDQAPYTYIPKPEGVNLPVCDTSNDAARCFLSYFTNEVECSTQGICGTIILFDNNCNENYKFQTAVPIIYSPKGIDLQLFEGRKDQQRVNIQYVYNKNTPELFVQTYNLLYAVLGPTDEGKVPNLVPVMVLNKEVLYGKEGKHDKYPTKQFGTYDWYKVPFKCF